MTRGKAAFTRLELVVVLGVLGVFGLVALPAGARSKSQADVSACLEHNRELISAWTSFALDNNDLFPTTLSMPNSDLPGLQPWAVGYMSWDPAPDNTNVTYLTNPKYSVIADFLGRRKEPFKCPADIFLSGGQRSLGWTERVRSVAGNGMLGWGTGGSPSGDSEDPYIRVLRFADLVRPGPSQTFAFIEEHPDSLGDCAFFGPTGSANSLTWWDYPASYHDGAAMLSFTDGRAELHHWRGLVRTMRVRYGTGSMSPSDINRSDQRWVFDRMPHKPN